MARVEISWIKTGMAFVTTGKLLEREKAIQIAVDWGTGIVMAMVTAMEFVTEEVMVTSTGMVAGIKITLLMNLKNQ